MGDGTLEVTIVVSEPLTAGMSRWFGGLDVSVTAHGTTISGTLADRTALHGVLDRIRDLNLELVSVGVRRDGRPVPQEADDENPRCCEDRADGNGRGDRGEHGRMRDHAK